MQRVGLLVELMVLLLLAHVSHSVTCRKSSECIMSVSNLTTFVL